MAGKLATSLFHSFDHATKAVRRLEELGIPSTDISFFCDSNECRSWSGGGANLRSHGVAEWLTREGVTSGDAQAYAEGVRRGGAVVAVRCTDANAPAVLRILDEDGVMDLDEQQSSWRNDGWTGAGSSEGLMGGATGVASALGLTGGKTAGSATTGTTTGSTTTGTATGASASARGDEVIPIVEEHLNVGKREVGHGRVRIHSYVVSTPVQEQVTLREEHVSVERRAVDQPVTGTAGTDLFRERTIEMEERSEEAVVSKEARVKEELVVRKDVEQRTQTIQDEVRRTEVDVNDERRTDATRTTGTTGRDRI